MIRRAFFALVFLLTAGASVDAFVHHDWVPGVVLLSFAAGVPTLYRASK